MKNQEKVICIFGGTGFLGHNVTQHLARAGYRIKIATRIPESAYELKTYGTIGQICAVPCDYRDPASINAAVKGCYGVVNLIGILYQKGKNSFQHAHVDIPTRIAKACQDNKVEKFTHVSALGIEESSSKYAKSKRDGEAAILKEFPAVSILRPSVVFGSGDSFINLFAKLSVFLPFLPLYGGGKTKFQPVFVGDIADAVLTIMDEKTDKFEGQTYHLGGTKVYSFKEIYEVILKETNRKRPLINMPWPVAKIQATFLGLLPKPLLTLDQIKSLRTDNVVPEGVKAFEDLGIAPTAMETIIPKYLSCHRRGGRFADKKSA